MSSDYTLRVYARCIKCRTSWPVVPRRTWFRGAGRCRRERRIRRTAASLTCTPRPTSSPWTRRYPPPRRTASAVWGGPRAFDQTPMRCQQGTRGDQPMSSRHRRQVADQRRQERPIGPVRLRPGNLALQYGHLMPEHHDLDVLACLSTPRQHEPAKHPNQGQIQQTNRHKPRSCPTAFGGHTRRSSTPR
jgi:hypothetical protein